MKDENFIISGFDSRTDEGALFAVDFTAAKRMEQGGSTCDVYECIVQRRRVFVKRLKAEYRDNPLYRSAFNKEYDLGVSLSHPSLPRYVGFGGDFIAMDFVEGDTLAALIRRNDRRLNNKLFIRKLLLELIDVVEYLHNRNIVHCDIKPDNIIVSPYADRPATLIDFDKAYSPWLDSTHGETAKYGCDGCADGIIDYKGIGLISERLGLKGVADACGKEDVRADSIKKLLRGNQYGWWILWGAIIVGGAVAMLWPGNGARTEGTKKTAEPVSSIIIDTVQETIPTPAQSASPEKPSISIAWIEALITDNSTEIEGYRQELWRILDSDTIPVSDKQSAIINYTYQSGLATNRIITTAVEKYRAVPELEVQMAVRNHPAWIRLTKEAEKMNSRIIEWQAKVSQRSSGRSASLPDTTQGADRLAPHQ